MQIFDEVVELIIRQREQCQHGEQLVSCFGTRGHCLWQPYTLPSTFFPIFPT